MPEIVPLIDFADAINRIPEIKQRHLLLGNGFSRALRNDIFSYSALFDQADFQALSSEARKAFDVLGTTDFETVMRALRDASKLVELYEPKNPVLAARLRDDASGLKEVLVQTIAKNHPDRPGDISPDSYSHCRTFISYFGTVYTLNYDLLLYWTLMQEELPPPIDFDDGFRTPDDGPDNYVTWEVEKTDKQNIHYLHGALHIFDAGSELQKYTWVNTGVPLIDQIRDALTAGLYPLFVAEGESDQKLAHIKHSGFLSRSYRSFAKLGHALYIYGHSMAPNDEHILRLIEKNRVTNLYVGLYGDITSEGNQRIIRRVQQMQNTRPDRRPLIVEFFAAESAHVWG